MKPLNRIRTLIDHGRTLQAVLAIAPFASIFSSHPTVALTQLALSITSGDWERWAQAVSSVPIIFRTQCQMIAVTHRARHPGAGELNRFWAQVEQSFA